MNHNDAHTRRDAGSPFDILLWREVFALGRTPRPGRPLSAALLILVGIVLTVAIVLWQTASPVLGVVYPLLALGPLCSEHALRAWQALEDRLERRRLARRPRGRGLFLLGRFTLFLLVVLAAELAMGRALGGSEAVTTLANDTFGAVVLLYTFLWYVHLMRFTVGAGLRPARRVRLDDLLPRAGRWSWALTALAITASSLAAAAR